MEQNHETILKQIEERASRGNPWETGFCCNSKPGETLEQYRERLIKEEQEYLLKLKRVDNE